MCNPAPSPTAAAPLAALLPDPASVFVGARLAISGTLPARDGLRASLSASEGLRLHVEEQPRFVLQPRPAPERRPVCVPDGVPLMTRHPGECARRGLVRLLQTPPGPAGAPATLGHLCTLVLWAQDMACEMDLRGGVRLYLSATWAPILDAPQSRQHIHHFAQSLSDRVSLELLTLAGEG